MHNHKRYALYKFTFYLLYLLTYGTYKYKYVTCSAFNILAAMRAASEQVLRFHGMCTRVYASARENFTRTSVSVKAHR